MFILSVNKYVIYLLYLLARILAGQVRTATVQCANTTRASQVGAVCGILAVASYVSVLSGNTASSVNIVSVSLCFIIYKLLLIIMLIIA